jgi:hypothetical protein
MPATVVRSGSYRRNEFILPKRLFDQCKTLTHHLGSVAAIARAMAKRYGADVSVLDQLRCSRCGGRDVDMILISRRAAAKLAARPTAPTRSASAGS